MCCEEMVMIKLTARCVRMGVRCLLRIAAKRGLISSSRVWTPSSLLAAARRSHPTLQYLI